MRKLVIAALAGIALLGISATAFILFLSRDEATGGDWFKSGTAAPEPKPLPQLTPLEAARIGTPPTSGPPPESLHEEPPPPPAPDTWEAVAPVGRVGALRGIGGAIGRELNEIRPRLEQCFGEETQSRFGQVPFSRTGDTQPLGDEGVTVLMLQLETRPGQVVIVDAPVEVVGKASDGLIACAQQVLRGVAIDVPSVKSGERYRVRYPLIE
jgi:hypothetical protein